MADLTTEQFEAATTRGDGLLQGPRAERVHYDVGRDRVIVRLTTGVEIGFAPHDAQGLQHASREDLSTIELDPFGLGIHFPRLDADLYVPALLQGQLGSTSWMEGRVRAATARFRVRTRTPTLYANGRTTVFAKQKSASTGVGYFPLVLQRKTGRKFSRSSLPIVRKSHKSLIRRVYNLSTDRKLT